MMLNLDRRMTIQDDDPTLNFQVAPSDNKDFELSLKGASLAVLKLTGVSKEQLVFLRDGINDILCKV